MPPTTATIGAANAGAAPGEVPLPLPVCAERDGGRAALETLLNMARVAGVGGARLFGHTASPAAHAGDCAHAVVGTAALGAAAAGLELGLWSLGCVIVSAGLRACGLPAADRLLPRRASWALVLRPCGRATRRVVACAADRARRLPWLPRVTLGALLVALLSLLGPAPTSLVAALALLVVAAVAAWTSSGAAPDPTGVEAGAARALVAHAVALSSARDDTTAVLVSAAASVDGGGVLSVLDWWGVSPSAAEIDLVGAPEALATVAEALGRAGWRVRIVPSTFASGALVPGADPRSPP